MVLTSYGAAQTVTGSKHLVTLQNGKRILLDCGLFQGKGPKTDELNWEFGFDPETINYLILSHAHIDHVGLVPRLVKDGFTGTIYCTQPTLEIYQLVISDSARIQQSDVERNGSYDKPLYTEEDVEESLKLFKTILYNKKYRIDEDIEVLFTDTGHVLGSAAVNLTLRENDTIRTLCFSGDIGRFNNRILKSPQPFPHAEIVICESTYGDKFHSTLQATEEQLLEIVKETCVEKGGKLLIPAFSIGRTQELIYSLNILAEAKRLPKVKVFVDSPLSVYATDIVRNHPECFNDDMLEFIKTDPDPFGFRNLHFIVEKDDSMLLNSVDEPCIIISSSGMMEGGRIRHHLRHNISDARNTILITGYCEPSTLGGQLQRGADKVRIFGDELEVKAEIKEMKEYSAHADLGDILKFLIYQDKEKTQCIFLVHGEKPTMERLQEELKDAGFPNVEIAQHRISYEL